MHLSANRVVFGGGPGAYTITAMPQGVVTNASSFPHGLRIAENLARERCCALDNATGHKPLTGDAGPHHLTGSPVIFVIDEGDAWAVVVLSPPWGFGPCGQSFVGPNATRAAERYARQLFDQFRQLAIAEQTRRDRIKQLKRSEVEAREMAR
ncbi:hypothetical protein [Sphingomonas sp.]|uniref:hypothetical protein n=1 Tax=Sphingomonas sp. TaxID=28214 RepID=UPI003753C841